MLVAPLNLYHDGGAHCSRRGRFFEHREFFTRTQPLLPRRLDMPCTVHVACPCMNATQSVTARVGRVAGGRVGGSRRSAPPPPPPRAASTEAAPPIANHLHPPLYAAAAHGRSSQRRCRARRRAPAAAAAAAARPRLLPAGSSVLRSPRHSGDAAGCRGRDRADAAPRRPRALSPALCSCLRRLQRSSAASGSWRRCRGAPPSLLPKSNNSNGSCLKLCPPAFFQPSAGCQQGRHDAAGQRRSEGAPECRGAAVRPRRCGGRPVPRGPP